MRVRVREGCERDVQLVKSSYDYLASRGATSARLVSKGGGMEEVNNHQNCNSVPVLVTVYSPPPLPLHTGGASSGKVVNSI